LWYDKIKDILDTTKDFEWTEIGGTAFRNILKVNRYPTKVYDQDYTCYPVHWSDSDIFFEKGDSNMLIRENQPLIMLYNHIFPKDFKDMNSEEFGEWLYSSDTILADMMRKY
jgi:hypothetical protein